MNRRARTLVLAALCLSAKAFAEERVRSFKSLITVLPDTTLTVQEEIRVHSEQNQIVHGIYRDFPTDYEDTHGIRYHIGFHVESVSLDGAPEDYHLAPQTNGMRVYIGKRDRYVSPGDHVYQLIYTTSRQLGFFHDHDELYWNVTGNGWTFPIDEAAAEVVLPDGASSGLLPLIGYTGRQGAHGTQFEARVSDYGHPMFATTHPLGSGEGLTIVVGWPKGFVHPPSVLQKWGWFLRDNPGPLVGLLGLFFIIGYYAFNWRQSGRDPAPGTIFPLYHAPGDLPPQQLRYIDNMRWDDKVMAAAILHLAVRGFLRIEQTGRSYILTRNTSTKEAVTPEESRFLTALFGSGNVLAMDQANCEIIQTARKTLEGILEGKSEGIYFHKNAMLVTVGITLSIGVVLANVFLDGKLLPDSTIIIDFVTIAWAWACAWSVHTFWRSYRQLNSYRDTSANRFSRMIIGAAATMGLLWIAYWGWSTFDMQKMFFLEGVLTAMTWVNYLFAYLLPAPTVAGRKLMDGIEGFRMFLGISEKERMNLLNPPEQTPALFERFLPYALALDVEQRWSEQFAGVLAKAGAVAGGQPAYYPSWYSGSAWNSHNLSSFSQSIGDSFTSVISSSATPPGQSSGGDWGGGGSSGGGGGGSSGGGGGGGGGGGW